MKIFDRLFRRRPPQVPRWFLAALIAISFIGFADAAYLTALHFLGKAPECSFLAGCEFVTTSKYAMILGVPVALLGAVYYLAILAAGLAYLDTRQSVILAFISRFTIVGLAASVWFVFLQIFVLRAACIYCLFSAVSSAALFGLGAWYIREERKYE